MSKTRVGSKLVRRYDEPKTPLERVIASKRADPVKIATLLRLRGEIDPFSLSKVIDHKLQAIWAMRSKAPKPVWFFKSPAFVNKRKFSGPPHDIDCRTTDRYERLHARETALNTW